MAACRAASWPFEACAARQPRWELAVRSPVVEAAERRRAAAAAWAVRWVLEGAAAASSFGIRVLRSRLASGQDRALAPSGVDGAHGAVRRAAAALCLHHRCPLSIGEALTTRGTVVAMDGLVVAAAMDVAIQRPCPEPDVAGYDHLGVRRGQRHGFNGRALNAKQLFVAISLRKS